MLCIEMNTTFRQYATIFHRINYLIQKLLKKVPIQFHSTSEVGFHHTIFAITVVKQVFRLCITHYK